MIEITAGAGPILLIEATGSFETACRAHLGDDARAAEFRGVAISQTGERHEISGLGLKAPGQAWQLHATATAKLSFMFFDATTVDLFVGEEGSGDAWVSSLGIEFATES